MTRSTVAILALLLVTRTVAHADPKAEAMALFEQGLADMEAGKTDLACRELAASLAKYEDSGTQGALAVCYTQLGRITSAWRLWKELADTAPTADLKADAATQASTLQPRLPRFKVTLVGPSIPGLTVTVDGSAADPSLEVELPVDPGPIAASASAPGYESWSSTFTAFEGKVTAIEIPALRPLPEEVKPPPPELIEPEAPARDFAGARRKHRRIGATLGIAGSVSVGVGAILGLWARASWSKATAACMEMLDPCQGDVVVAQGYADDALLAARFSTGLFIAGAAAIVTGAYFWFTAPSLERSTRSVRLAPAVDARSVGVVLFATWR